MPVKDPIKRKEIRARYWAKHKDRLNAEKKLYYQENKTEILKKSKIWSKNWRTRNPKRHKQIYEDWMALHPGKKKEYDRSYYLRHSTDRSTPSYKSQVRFRVFIQTRRLREKLLHILGQFWCQNCGEHDQRCLHIDHIYDNGYEDRIRFGGDPTKMARYYIKHPEEARSKLQIMCANCNWRKRYENGNTNQWFKLNGGGLKQ